MADRQCCQPQREPPDSDGLETQQGELYSALRDSGSGLGLVLTRALSTVESQNGLFPRGGLQCSFAWWCQ